VYVGRCKRLFVVATHQGEAAVLVVIEFFGQPVHRHVAPITGHGQAVVRPTIFELAPVGVLVTHPALPRHSPEAEARFGARMTGQAISLQVTAVENVPGRAVVEGHAAPTVLAVTGQATGLRRIFFRVTEVRVRVAGHTGIVGWSQIHRQGIGIRTERTMAGVAGSRQMRADQGISRNGVLFDRIPGGPESLHRVAILASRQPGPLQFRTAMDIVMAVGAGGEGRLLPPFGVAPRAGHRSVPAQEGIPGLPVVERIPLDEQPPIGHVALAAVRSQSAGMGVKVAIGAGGVGSGREHQGRFAGALFRNVALGTVHGLMLSRQGKRSPVMGEHGRGFPPFVGVAFRACPDGGFRLPVHVFMTGNTGGIQPQIGASKILSPPLEAACIDHVFGVVAFPAVKAGVLAGFFEADGPVVESLRAVRPVDQFEILALMFDVAIDACAEIASRVHSRPAGAHRGDFGVAIEALRPHVTAAEFVAVRAFLDAFEMGMGAAQGAGRELGLDGGIDIESHYHRANKPTKPPTRPRGKRRSILSARLVHPLPNSQV
jgi:hypothetical protein